MQFPTWLLSKAIDREMLNKPKKWAEPIKIYKLWTLRVGFHFSFSFLRNKTEAQRERKRKRRKQWQRWRKITESSIFVTTLVTEVNSVTNSWNSSSGLMENSDTQTTLITKTTPWFVKKSFLPPPFSKSAAASSPRARYSSLSPFLFFSNFLHLLFRLGFCLIFLVMLIAKFTILPLL